MTLPNLISIARLFAVPLAVWLILRERLDLAFILFCAAGLSDAVDGYLARVLHAKTTLGRYLDPLADKVLLVSIFVTLGYAGRIDYWLVILVVTRDVMIVGGFAFAYFLSHPMEAKPSFASKINTTVQLIYLAAVLASGGFNIADWFPQGAMIALAIAVGITTLASGLGYLYAWWRHMAAHDLTSPDDTRS